LDWLSKFASDFYDKTDTPLSWTEIGLMATAFAVVSWIALWLDEERRRKLTLLERHVEDEERKDVPDGF
jgi:hypothetical protein